MDSNFSQNRRSHNKRPIILVVENNNDDLLLISHALISLQYTLVAAAEIKIALSITKHYQPDLIVLDVMLSGEDGLQLVRRLKKNKLRKRNIKAPIIGVTTLSSQEEGDRLLAEGCDDYLTKPYLLEDLERKINCYISAQNLNTQYQNNLVSAVS